MPDQQAHETAAVRTLRALGTLIDNGQVVRGDDSRHACVLVSVRYDDLMATMHALKQCHALAGEAATLVRLAQTDDTATLVARLLALADLLLQLEPLAGEHLRRLQRVVAFLLGFLDLLRLRLLRVPLHAPGARKPAGAGSEHQRRQRLVADGAQDDTGDQRGDRQDEGVQ
jgi:hypothetical protein